MSTPGAHKASSSNHKLYHEALRLVSLYVYVALAYGAVLLAAAFHLAELPVGFLLGLQDAPMEKPQAGGGSAGEGGWVRTGALSLGTAGVAGLLMAILVRRCCRLDRAKAVVVANWHDLFKYAHLGRTTTAALTAVLTWRGMNALKESNTNAKTKTSASEGAAFLLVGAAVLSMATSASMNFLYFRVKAVHTEYYKLQEQQRKRS